MATIASPAVTRNHSGPHSDFVFYLLLFFMPMTFLRSGFNNTLNLNSSLCWVSNITKTGKPMNCINNSWDIKPQKEDGDNQVRWGACQPYWLPPNDQAQSGEPIRWRNFNCWFLSSQPHRQCQSSNKWTFSALWINFIILHYFHETSARVSHLLSLVYW